ncbi:hypothetical protein AAOGI_41430 [Agarivorans albus]
MKKLFLMLTLLPALVNASGITSVGKIAHIYVNNGWTMVHLTDVSTNPDSCESASYYAIKPSDANYSSLHATLLAAQVAGKRVKFWVNGCSGQGNKHPKIVSVFMYSD